MSEYTAQCFPLSAFLTDMMDMFHGLDAEILHISMRKETVYEYDKNLAITAVLDGKEEVEVSVKIRAARKSEAISDA